MIGHNGGPQIDLEKGFLVFYKDWRNHHLVGVHNPEYFTWWVDLMCEAAYEGGQRTVNGHHYQLNEGDLVGAYRFLAERWGVPVKRVRTFVDKLELAGLATRNKEGTPRGTQAQVISVNHYNEICKFVSEKRHAERQAKGTLEGTQEAHTGAHKGHKLKEVKEINTHTDTRARTREAGPNEEEVSHGVIVNCETIRHKDGHFALSIPGIELRTQGTVPRDRVLEITKAYALQWGLEIESGKDPRKVVPNDAMAYMSAQVRKEFTRPIDEEFKRKRQNTEKTVRQASADRVMAGIMEAINEMEAGK